VPPSTRTYKQWPYAVGKLKLKPAIFHSPPPPKRLNDELAGSRNHTPGKPLATLWPRHSPYCRRLPSRVERSFSLTAQRT
jgi:hypothetical protein